MSWSDGVNEPVLHSPGLRVSAPFKWEKRGHPAALSVEVERLYRTLDPFEQMARGALLFATKRLMLSTKTRVTVKLWLLPRTDGACANCELSVT